MIYEIEGDILLTRAQVIAHGVASKDPMTSGLARNLHHRYPAMVTAFNQWCQLESPAPGQIWHWGGLDKQQIVNLITRESSDDDVIRPGREFKIAVNRSLSALKKMAMTERFTSIAMPKLGSGFGGLDWYEVRGMMDSQLGDCLIPVYVYVSGIKGQIGSEPGL